MDRQNRWRKFVMFTLALSTAAVGASANATSWTSGEPKWAVSETTKSPKRVYKPKRISNVSPFSPGSHNLSFELGQVFLMGKAGGEYSDNIGTQIHYNYGVSEIFAFDASLGFSKHLAQSEQDVVSADTEQQLSMFRALAGLRTNLAWYDRIVPYISFGLGFYRPSYKINEDQTVAPFLFGLHLGPGINLQLSRSLFFGTGLTFHDIFGSKRNSANGPIDVGGTFTTFFLNAGVTF